MRLPVRVLARLLPLLAVLLVVVVPAPVRAAGATFGTGEAKATFTEGITFTIPITVTEPLERVEIRLSYPDAIGPFIADVPAPGVGSHTLEYRLDFADGGHLVPNTTIDASWAALGEGEAEAVESDILTVRYEDTSQDWRTLSGNLVDVHWYDGDEAFAQRALDIAEKAVADTADLLGVTETERIDFFIYADNQAFRTALGPGTRENVGGQAHADIRTLFGLANPDDVDAAWLGVLVPHELVHLVFDTAVQNPYRFPPRWVNEGLAVYLSEGYGGFDRGMVQDAVDDRTLMPLTALTGQFPTDPRKTSLAYAEAVSAIDYLVRTYDQDALLTLIESYTDGLTDDEAFERALGVDVGAFQGAWLAEIGAVEPEAYGPVPNPPGPLPPGWDAPIEGQPTAVPGSSNALPTAGPGSPGDGSGASTSDVGGILVAIGLVVVVVVAGMLVARRRTAGPVGPAGPAGP